MDAIMDTVEWRPVPPPDDFDGLPYPTHEGTLRIGKCELQCIVLSNGMRIFTEESVLRFFAVAE